MPNKILASQRSIASETHGDRVRNLWKIPRFGTPDGRRVGLVCCTGKLAKKNILPSLLGISHKELVFQVFQMYPHHTYLPKLEEDPRIMLFSMCLLKHVSNFKTFDLLIFQIFQAIRLSRPEGWDCKGWGARFNSGFGGRSDEFLHGVGTLGMKNETINAPGTGMWGQVTWMLVLIVSGLSFIPGFQDWWTMGSRQLPGCFGITCRQRGHIFHVIFASFFE